MSRVTLLMFTVFLTLALYFNGVLAANSDGYSADDKRKDSEKKYFWFGPRIGRRKRNPSENVFKSLDRDELDTIAADLKNPWALMALNNVKRQMNFTPRLGRESAEEDEEIDYEELIRRKPFTPRLGRRLSLYSPRLGRENDFLVQ